jgi:GrpB-like predicted nucleotidyltransferase (UPF0157 family)
VVAASTAYSAARPEACSRTCAAQAHANSRAVWSFHASTRPRGFRDALRADPRLRRRCAALKRAIVAGGPVDPMVFSNAKHDWIVAALGQLGLANPRHPRLYGDSPTLLSTWAA